ncbi:hypothetical protein OESDEN_02545 [Oesophagostomum dentatum]|uniref:Uncharacterized protein n=1 Tax=Oesophagostomum dentatum TaxID=61180 RepID=A0A0B1TIT9_OESDE|nr:hypothetical protein OESDEN_02545 [Oesophagostomum dentatum]
MFTVAEEDGQNLHGFCGVLKRFIAALFSETALKFHLFIYWLFCLFDMIEEQPQSMFTPKFSQSYCSIRLASR